MSDEKKPKRKLLVYFSDFFGIPESVIESYGAFNISLVNDLPLFIDPFLLFESDKPRYQELHNDILKYVIFLRDKAANEHLQKGLIEQWFFFPEVKQNWFGYSKVGNGGSGLGNDFAKALLKNLSTVFKDFGSEEITESSHLEKLCIVKSGVGKDNLSDFSTNLIKRFLLEYTEEFAKKHLKPSQVKEYAVPKTVFNYETEHWMTRKFLLPSLGNDYVILTPKDLLTKDEPWINGQDIIGNFGEIASSITNLQLRDSINNYFKICLPPPPSKKRAKKVPTKREIAEAVAKVIQKYPEFIDYYIKLKEDTGDEATSISQERVLETERLFIQKIQKLVDSLDSETLFYEEDTNSFEEAKKRVEYLKHVIENNDGYKIFYVGGEPIKREVDLQIMFRLTWCATSFDINSEVNNGRGPVDYKISKGKSNSSLVEFKLASNSKLSKNLQNQVEVYEKANRTAQSLKVILFFTEAELDHTLAVMKTLGLSDNENIVLIDARRDNKPSGSNA